METPFNHFDLPEDSGLSGFEVEPTPHGWTTAKNDLKRLYGFESADFSLSFAEEVIYNKDLQVGFCRMTPSSVPKTTQVRHDVAVRVSKETDPYVRSYFAEKTNVFVQTYANGSSVDPSNRWPDFGLILFKCPQS